MFFKELFSGGNNKASSKRVFGGIGFVCSILIIWTKQPQMVDYLLTVSASLLGLETITQIFKKNETK